MIPFSVFSGESRISHWGCRPVRGHQPLTLVLFSENTCERERIGSCWGVPVVPPGSATAVNPTIINSFYVKLMETVLRLMPTILGSVRDFNAVHVGFAYYFFLQNISKIRLISLILGHVYVCILILSRCQVSNLRYIHTGADFSIRYRYMSQN